MFLRPPLPFPDSLGNDKSVSFSIGHFYYIETSSPRKPGDVALLESPDYPASKHNQCFAFFYHILGDHIGEFNVYITHDSLNDLVFSKNETQGDMWHKAQIQLPPMAKTFKVTVLNKS